MKKKEPDWPTKNTTWKEFTISGHRFRQWKTFVEYADMQAGCWTGAVTAKMFADALLTSSKSGEVEPK